MKMAFIKNCVILQLPKIYQHLKMDKDLELLLVPPNTFHQNFLALIKKLENTPALNQIFGQQLASHILCSPVYLLFRLKVNIWFSRKLKNWNIISHLVFILLAKVLYLLSFD